MKKWLYLPFILSLVILCAACSSLIWKKQYADSPPKELLSDGEEYSILAVGEDIDHPEEIMGLKQVRYFSSLKEVKNQYPDLKIEGSPFFIIFNDKEIVLRTSELNKAIRFVEENY
ncbi:hypothetical protein ACS78_07445 [Priestia megaterium]|uniref:hypothetical protein n=1 Tax=Priestia megaterium TaxID=1404 RepID=UPI00067FEEA8|nr:hypothetical protein [Priestia megaterium]KNH24093.1 hypothetical protein ACS78_07445 [Priestia megaterium]